MATYSVSLGLFTLNANVQYPDNTIIYTLSTPDGSAVIGTESQIGLGATTAGHPPGHSELTIVRVGQAEFELTNEEATTLVTSFGQMFQTVTNEAQQQLTTTNVIINDSASDPTLNSIATSPTVTQTNVDTAPDISVIATSPNATTDPSIQSTADPITGGIRVDPSTITPESVAASNGDLSVISKPITVTQEEVNAAKGDLTNIATSPNAPSANPPITVASRQDSTQFEAKSDWRVRLSLSPDCNYLYRAPKPGILAPLAPKANGGTDGVIFPYTPTISVNYAASYEPVNVVHSNYRVNQYTNSYIDSVTINGDFTAQDSKEANYLLAVIHFFRTMTKMFYGQDQDPKRGTPPPLCYLFGMGTFQFSAHPLAITGFSYNLPNDVDYIKTVSYYSPGAQQPSTGNNVTPGRMTGLNVGPGGKAKSPQFSGLSTNQNGEVTWVPTKIQLSITCIPMQSRNQVSNKFSLEKYATGDLLKGTVNPGGGFW